MESALLKSALLGHPLISSSFSLSHKPQVPSTLFNKEKFHFSVHPTYSIYKTRDFSVQSLSTNEPVVSVNWLYENYKSSDVKVLDASWYKLEHRNQFHEYQIAHIPGAVYFAIDGISDKQKNLPRMMPSEKSFSVAVSAIGIQNKDAVVVYDASGIYSAARVWWMFKAFGHERVWVLDGGLPRWSESGFEVESYASDDCILKSYAAVWAVDKVNQGQTVAPMTFQTKFHPHLVWTLEQVKKNIEEKTHQHIDARSKARFDGVAPEPRKGLRSGHIPGSKCIPFRQILNASRTLLPADKLIKQFDQEGISLESPIVTSSGTGVTACILALGFHRLGKTDVSVYDGSWMEWGAQSINTPVEKNN